MEIIRDGVERTKLIWQRMMNEQRYGVFATDDEMFTVAQWRVETRDFKSAFGEHVWCRAEFRVPYNKFGMELSGMEKVEGTFRTLDSHQHPRTGVWSYSEPRTSRK